MSGYNAVYTHSHDLLIWILSEKRNETFAFIQDSLLRLTQELGNTVTLQLKVCLWLCTRINSRQQVYFVTCH
jgi:hypothetical protein